MNSSKKDYRKLYQLQDKYLDWWRALDLPFYLTGGTALGRFYLNHRCSEDLDFFVNHDPLYPGYIDSIRREITQVFTVNMQQALFADDFTRFFISSDDAVLKVEFVNDVGYRSGKPVKYDFGLLDTPFNILSNKLTAILSRDEPKDIFDIVSIAKNYSFNWQDVFNESKEKAVINEIDVEERLCTFNPLMLKEIGWNIEPVDIDLFTGILKKLADDFLLGADNSICLQNNPLHEAKPL